VLISQTRLRPSCLQGRYSAAILWQCLDLNSTSGSPTPIPLLRCFPHIRYKCTPNFSLTHPTILISVSSQHSLNTLKPTFSIPECTSTPAIHIHNASHFVFLLAFLLRGKPLCHTRYNHPCLRQVCVLYQSKTTRNQSSTRTVG
jgi:hypothetical protein